ncbi:hypothetical protein GQ53DRAFT_444799 [Thozetella sp. PMI_491]|nr:hypothetical protein GQ53DRAFT_444799 [Thozetella sp. PMI_491]
MRRRWRRFFIVLTGSRDGVCQPSSAEYDGCDHSISQCAGRSAETTNRQRSIATEPRRSRVRAEVKGSWIPRERSEKKPTRVHSTAERAWLLKTREQRHMPFTSNWLANETNRWLEVGPPFRPKFDEQINWRGLLKGMRLFHILSEGSIANGLLPNAKKIVYPW